MTGHTAAITMISTVNWGAASALAVILLIMTLACLAVAAKFLKLDKAMGGGQQ